MYSIGEVSRLSGVNVETIRYYEREGILPAPARSGSGRRIYDADGLSKLRFVKKCRDIGFPMNDARALLGLATAGGMNCGQAKPIALKQNADIEARIEQLTRLRAALTTLIGQCHDPEAECPLLRELLAT